MCRRSEVKAKIRSSGTVLLVLLGTDSRYVLRIRLRDLRS